MISNLLPALLAAAIFLIVPLAAAPCYLAWNARTRVENVATSIYFAVIGGISGVAIDAQLEAAGPVTGGAWGVYLGGWVGAATITVVRWGTNPQQFSLRRSIASGLAAMAATCVSLAAGAALLRATLLP
ncbi:MAG: hypothetical protein QGG36_01890 [Pirellulaceae bacterium]|jgi:hypothetical protein|nr:hypothetical protein [Pirellulaceae bacterium]MDP7014530.1 hypothetical protein [Pirellulaceae bacterium]